MKKNYLTVKELAEKSKIHINSIYYYIKKGLLPRPEHFPRERVTGKRSGGILAVYDKKFLKTIKTIRHL
jgi:predicted DNA-binding transcriptional regulator AlpA